MVGKQRVRPDRYQFPWRRLAFGVVLLAGIIWLFSPVKADSLISNPRPDPDYSASIAHLKSLQERENPLLNPDCRPQVLDHGERVEHAIVFIHGLTSCPKQFTALADTFFNLGYNVINLPLPQHGRADRMTTDLQNMKAEELAAYADETVDLALGLGEKVTVVGFSAGGTVAGWIAQTRSDVDAVVLISPVFGFKPIPNGLTIPVTRLAGALPNFYVWWDPIMKELGGLPHAYPRYSTRALAQLLRLGFAIQMKARQTPPQVKSILIVTNENDPNLNQSLTDEVARLWRAHGAKVERYEFEQELGLPHDIVDPAHPYGRTDIVYPRLIPLIEQQTLQQ